MDVGVGCQQCGAVDGEEVVAYCSVACLFAIGVVVL